jgi:four helix bundle protein
MKRTGKDLKQRTKNFALRVIRVVESLPNRRAATIIGGQLLRSGTSVGANYRAACRARSDAEFRAKLGIVEEEVDESAYWMEMLIESKFVSQRKLQNLLKEAYELLAITVASINTSRQNARVTRNRRIAK